MWWSSVASASSTFMPPVASDIAPEVDALYAFLLIGSLISFIILIGGMCYFIYKYKRRSENDKTAYITHNNTLEFLWSFVPFVIFMFSFAWGWIVYHKMRSENDQALEVHVIAKKWDWRFLYKSGKEITSSVSAEGAKEPATMVVPLNRPVKLIMASDKVAPGGQDPTDRAVLHSFFVPAFRVKQDVVPGRYTALWFTPTEAGDFWIYCTEYCGVGHSAMLAKIRVVPTEQFETWLASEGAGGGDLPLVDLGRQLYVSKACNSCHSLDGSQVVGPSFKGLGSKPRATEDYLRQSILNPNAVIVEGFRAGIMPTFAGQLDEKEVTALVEFIKSNK